MRRSWWLILVPVALLLAITIPNILSHNQRGRGYSDQVNYHQRIIERFAQQWPTPDLHDYPGVMTPAYHLLQAFAYRYISTDLTTLQLLGSVFGPATLLVVGIGLARRAPGVLACLLLMPLAACMYIWDSTIWLLPDNMAWVLVAGVLTMCVAGKGFTGFCGVRRLVIAGVLMFLLIATRQSNIWLAAVVWAWAFAGQDPPEQTMVGALGDLKRRIPRTMWAVAATIPAFALLGWFFAHWGSRFQPPMWDEWYSRKWNLSALPFVLGLVGLFSVFFGGFLLPTAIDLLRRRALLVVGAAALAALLGAAAPSDYDMSMGRYGAIWSIADKFPAVAHRSLLMIALSACGGVAILCWGAALDFRRRWVFLTAVAAFGATQMKNPWLYQRYAEPLLLMLFALCAAVIWDRMARAAVPSELGDASLPAFGTAGSRVAEMGRRVSVPARYLGPAVLALALGLMGYQTMRSAGDVKVMAEGEIGHPPSSKR